jgi:hypothetical protein
MTTKVETPKLYPYKQFALIGLSKKRDKAWLCSNKPLKKGNLVTIESDNESIWNHKKELWEIIELYEGRQG